MAVNRCICRDILFVDALALARRVGCRTVAELQAHCTLGTGCGLCIPYMQRALATGETDLPVLGRAESQLWLDRSGLIPEGEG
jgi:bacterioferritin-associated ferredoxin